MIYWDTSCVLKLYVQEKDSEFWTGIAENSPDPVFSSNILKAEINCALYSLEAGGMLQKDRAEDLFNAFYQDVEDGMFILMPVGEDIMEASRWVAKSCHALDRPIPIRALDAIHLATCKQFKCDSIATADHLMQKTANLLNIQNVTIS